MIDRDEAITDEMVEAMAAVIWNWRWEFEHKSGSRPYPYERLIEPTKDDLRELARRFREAVLREHPPVVTDEMVYEALVAYYPNPDPAIWEGAHILDVAARMRAALEAALREGL